MQPLRRGTRGNAGGCLRRVLVRGGFSVYGGASAPGFARHMLKFQLSASAIARPLALCAILLTMLHVVVVTVHYQWVELDWLWRSLFDLDEEQSFGTWFSTGILAFAGMLLLLFAHHLRLSGQDRPGYWRWLGYGFLLLSADEVAGLHESLNTAIEISWTIPAAVLIVGFVSRVFIGHDSVLRECRQQEERRV